ncbi:MAG TPA: polysaccharide pyruvyl transferase family protein [Pseudonocardiaceae bacterium]|jgi:hypothetical protein|nr:polysaccharide pyruvyl transferase family protein [Pseudonocardiaceae bacterium]
MGSPRTDTAPVEPPTIYLVGTCGGPNYGDELITSMWLRRLAIQQPNAKVFVDCPSPGPSSLLMGHLHPNVQFVDTLWRLCWESPVEDPWELSTWIRHSVNDVNRVPRLIGGIERLVSADILHVIGGGFINDNWPRHIGLLAGVAAAARRSGARAVLTDQGMIPTPEKVVPLLGLLAGQFEIVDVRDKASAELLVRAGVEHARQSVDDAFLAVGEDMYRQGEEQLPEFMMCVQSDLLAMDRGTLAGFVSQTLREWKVDPGNLGIVECIPGVDREIYALLELDLPGARIFPFLDVWKHGLPAAPGQTWLSTRFHIHLAAAAIGANGAAVSINPDYYVTKHRSLVDLGSHWGLSTGLAIPQLPTEGGFEPEVLTSSVADKEKVASAIYGPVEAPGRRPLRTLLAAARKVRG